MAVDVLAEIPGVNMQNLRLKGFKVHEVPVSADTRDMPVSRGRRDFYKMGLVSGDMTVYYGDKILEINAPVLFFVNPRVPHAVVRRSKNTGYACLFTEAFIKRTEILKTPLYIRPATALLSG